LQAVNTVCSNRVSANVHRLQTKQVADMKVLLRDSAERERTLLQEKQELEEKVYHNCYAFRRFI